MELPLKQTTLRYCPVVGHNVILEFEYGKSPISDNGAQYYQICHDFHRCKESKGGCTNKVFTCK